MLRKKLKLDEKATDTRASPLGEFSLSQFANVPKAKISANTVPPESGSDTHESESRPEKLKGDAVIPNPGVIAPYWQQVYLIERELSAALRKVVLPSDVAACYDPI
uniref:Uncharacterized protein n=1 Tax=Anopheles maculatus TaxID=74869 RepID=A0A182SJQ2_9DIPT